MSKDPTLKHADAVVASPLNDIVIAAMFTDADSAGLAAEYLVKDVLGEYGKRLGKVISVKTQDYHKLANFRGCRVDVVCRTDDNELWLVEFQMYDDEHIFERNLVELSYLIIESTSSGTTVEEMAEDIPHIVVLNFLNFRVRSDNADWLQPAHITFDKEPRRVAYNKLDMFNIQLPLFAEREPDYSDDGECWLYVMYQSHIKKITPQEVLNMDTRLDRFANTNPGFQQFKTRFKQALADPGLMEELRMEASERIRQAGMRKAILKQGIAQGIEQGVKQGIAQGVKQGAREIALSLLKEKVSLGIISKTTGLTAEEVRALQAEQNFTNKGLTE
jgi:predicted transposase/invertase (TIGR01784 family)